MNNKLFQLRSFATYWLDAADAHSLHSPFLYDLYTNTINNRIHDTASAWIEPLRQLLLNDRSVIQVSDLGAGSSHLSTPARAVSDIAKTSLSPAKYSLLYKRLIQRMEGKVVLELGTSLGINALYLASAPGTGVTTFEGSSAIAGKAKDTFGRSPLSNITLIAGNINDTLPAYLETVARVDFAFLDANHRYEPTMKYFQQLLTKTDERSVIVADDIHYSPEMENAWTAIRKHGRVKATVDLYRCGIVFFDPKLQNQHVVLRF